MCEIVPLVRFRDDYGDKEYQEEAQYWIEHRIKTGALKPDSVLKNEVLDKDKHPNNGMRIGQSFEYRSAISYLHRDERGLGNVLRIWDVKDVIPFKCVEFEGYEFYSPNNEDSYLKVYFGDDYMDIPNEVGFISHGYYSEIE